MKPTYLQLYDQQYFAGGAAVSSYGDYAGAQPVLTMWSDMLDQQFRPSSVLDVGAAYGFVVEWFQKIGVFAAGIEPSEWARSKSRVPLYEGYLPNIALVGDDGKPLQFDLVVCTEVLEHVPEEHALGSLISLAEATKRKLVLLIMVEGHPTAHDDAGHVSLHSREWWEARLDLTGLVPDREAETALNEHAYSEHMKWSGRLFVRTR